MNMRPLLQVALDLTDRKRALEIADLVAPMIDILEVGTPLLKALGVGIITNLKQLYPHKLILADTKTMDVGGVEAELVFKARADMMTVCAAAPLETIKAAITKTRSLSKIIVIDFIGIKNKLQRAIEIAPLKPDYFNLHTAIDVQQARGKSFEDLNLFKKHFNIPLCVAGGITPQDISELMPYKPAIIIVGGFVTKAKDPKSAVIALKKEIEHAL